MTMTHHDERPYDVAVGEAAETFRKRLEERIHGSVSRVANVIEQVERDIPADQVALGRALHFEANGAFFAARAPGVVLEPNQRGLVAITPDKQQLQVHDHALAQVAGRAGIRNLGTVVSELRSRGEWGAKLVAHFFNEVYSHLNGDRFLLRSVRGELRGFLSDKYRRLDSRPVLEAFIKGIQEFGARPIDGFALQTKIHLRAILPYVFEPFPGEIMAFGAEIRDSDYGDGKLAVNGFVERMWCTNLATTEDVLSQVHLGKRLPDNVQFSTQTYELDTKAMASAVNDVTKNVLGSDAVNRYLAMVKRANEEKIAPSAITTWVKKHLNKEEGEKVVEKFSSADVELLPAGQTAWRWSNALSWLANETSDERRKLELQDFAGGAMTVVE